MRSLGPERSDGTRALICDAVTTVMLEKDAVRITVRDVCEAASVSRTTFYRYYDSVGDAIEEVEDYYLKAIADINRIGLMTHLGRESDKLSTTMVMRLELLHSNRKDTLALNGPHGPAGFGARVDALMRDYYATKLQGTGLSRQERELYLAFITGGHARVLLSWLRDYPEVSPERMAAILNRMFYAPLLRD